MLTRSLRYARHLAGRGPLSDMGRTQRLLAQNLRVIFLMARWDVYDRLKLHAQALTYDTLLALVPLVVVSMAIVKSFGGLGHVADRLQDLLLSNISAPPEVQLSVGEHIRDFVLNIQTGSVGALSLLLLVFSVLSLLGHIEFAFNVIFGVKSQRPLAGRLMVYWAVLSLGPLLLAASFAATKSLGPAAPPLLTDGNGASFGWLVKLVPLWVTWALFAVVYIIVPAARVRLGAALPAAVIAGSLWHLGKYLYAIYARNAFAVHNIYGSLATIPLFILWTYVSWLLVLLGAQLAFALQHAASYRPADDHRPPHAAARDIATCRIFLAVAEDFYMSRPATDRDTLATRLGLPIHLVEELLAHLVDQGYLRETEPSQRLVPGRDLAQVTVADLLQSLRHAGASPHMVPDPATTFLAQLLGELDTERQRLGGAVNFHELASRFGGATTPELAAAPSAVRR